MHSLHDVSIMNYLTPIFEDENIFVMIFIFSSVYNRCGSKEKVSVNEKLVNSYK